MSERRFGGRRRVTGCRRALAVAAVGAIGLGFHPHSPAAHAETSIDLLPSLTAGLTSNATLESTGSADAFTILSALGRVQARGPRATAIVGTHLSLTHYFHTGAGSAGTAELLLQSTFTLTPALELRLFGTGTLSQVSQSATLGLLSPQATPGGTAVYLATNAGEDLSWELAPGWRLSEGFAFSRVSYPFDDQETPGHRGIASLTGGGRIETQRVLSTFWLDGRATEIFFGHGQALDGTEQLAETSWLGQALLGWRRELSVDWSSDLEAGAAYMSNGAAPDIYVPAGHAALSYRRSTWNATLEAAQLPTVNMLTAQATINDQAYLRLVLPLSERELAAVAAIAGYIYARGADAQGNLYRAYDQQSLGARASMLIGRLPLSGSIEYTFVNQHGGAGLTGAPTPDLIRHTIMLTLTGALSWGPHTPPLLDSGRVLFPGPQ
jgi:hypothetical protein